MALLKMPLVIPLRIGNTLIQAVVLTKGRDSVLKLVRAVHQTFLKGVTMKIESMNIRFVAPGVAIADVIHQVDNYITPDGAHHENERHIKTYVLVKQRGKWLLTQDHNTIILPQNPK
jgi:uncharacterized protein (TIGR02246 family)